MQAAMSKILAAGLGALLALQAHAQVQVPAQEEPPLAPAPQAAAPRPNFEGARGLQINNSPEYQGSDRRKTSLKPGIYLRWGRYWVATASNFVTRRDDEVVRGVGAELVQRDDLRVQLGLRYDPGRKTSDSPDLEQLDDVRATLRGRVSASWRFRPDWQLGSTWSADVLGRKTGSLVDLSLGHEIRLSPRTVWSLGTGLSWGDANYMIARFGISPAAAARTGKAEYVPGSGLRDMSLSTQVRTDIDKRWSVWTQAGIGRLLGPARDSPLTKKPTQYGAGVGFAWRF